MNRRDCFPVLLTCLLAVAPAFAADAEPPPPKKKVAALVADWFPRSHPDVIIRRMLTTYTMDGKGESSKFKLVSLYRDIPSKRDIGAELAEAHDFKLYDNIADTLTLGTGKLAVDGVILCTEWATYPVSSTVRIGVAE